MKAERAQFRAIAVMAARAAIESQVTTADIVARLVGAGDEARALPAPSVVRTRAGGAPVLAVARS